MVTATATATEMQNNFGRYLNLVMSGQEVIVTKNGREVGRFIPKDAAVSYLTDPLSGILKGDCDLDEARAEMLKEKYETYAPRKSAILFNFCLSCPVIFFSFSFNSFRAIYNLLLTFHN